jgi:hypothetical protein
MYGLDTVVGEMGRDARIVTIFWKKCKKGLVEKGAGYIFCLNVSGPFFIATA